MFEIENDIETNKNVFSPGDRSPVITEKSRVSKSPPLVESIRVDYSAMISPIKP